MKHIIALVLLAAGLLAHAEPIMTVTCGPTQQHLIVSQLRMVTFGDDQMTVVTAVLLSYLCPVAISNATVVSTSP